MVYNPLIKPLFFLGCGFIGWCYPVGWSVTSVKSRPGKYCTQLSRLHASEGCDGPQIRHSLVIQVSVGSTVDGSEIRRSPVELGSSSPLFTGSYTSLVQDFVHQQYHHYFSSRLLPNRFQQVPKLESKEKKKDDFYIQFIGGTFI